MSAAAVSQAPVPPASSARPRAYQGPARGHDHDDRDAVLGAFSMSTPYHAAQALGLQLAPGMSPRKQSVRVLCPWHSDRAPSCDVTIKRGRLVARCRSCGEGGDVLSIVAAIEGLHARRDFGLVLERAASLVGVDVRAARRAPVGPLSPIDELRIQLRDARAETARIEAEARALREALAIERAERAAQGDALREVIAGLSDALVAARAALRGLATVAARGTRAEVQAAIDALAGVLG